MISDGRRAPCALLPLLCLTSSLASCAPGRVAVVGPAGDPSASAEAVARSTRLQDATRIDFTWSLNESGSRVEGVGVARIEAPYRARLDLFLKNQESVISAAVVDDELLLPPGAPDDVLPPVDLMWATLGVFRPMAGTTLVGGDRLENGAERLRYRYADGSEMHFEVGPGGVSAAELLDGSSVVQWVRLEGARGERFPASARYRNLVDYRELTIERTSVTPAEAFDPAIFDPR